MMEDKFVHADVVLASASSTAGMAWLQLPISICKLFKTAHLQMFDFTEFCLI